MKELGEHIKTWHECFKAWRDQTKQTEIIPSIEPLASRSIMMTLLYYRVHWWYLDKDDTPLEHVDYELAQMGYPKAIGQGDLHIGGWEHSTIIPRRRVLQVQIDQISEAEYRASQEQPQ